MPIFWEKHLRIKKCVIKAVKTRLLGERKQSGAVVINSDMGMI